MDSNNLSSENRKARFLVERERFVDDRSHHVLTTNIFASGLSNRAIMTKKNIPGKAQCNAARLYFISQLRCSVPRRVCFIYNWGKQALFLTFTQNRSIIISKALFTVSHTVLHTNHYNCKGNPIDELTLSLSCLCMIKTLKHLFDFEKVW